MGRRNFVRPAAPRRKTDWTAAGDQPTTLVSVPTAQTRVVSSIVVTEGAIFAPTIVRIRGTVHIELAAETAAESLIMYGIGIGLFDDRAFAVANAAGLPKPILDSDDEAWMWMHYGHIGTGPDLSNPPPVESDATGRKIAVDIEVDSKAMRKWDENQTLAWVCQNALIDGTATEIDVSVFGRMLVKLP